MLRTDIVEARSIKCVAVQDAFGEWAAYYGDIDDSDDAVASHGYKLPHIAALRLFPNIAGRYRD